MSTDLKIHQPSYSLQVHRAADFRVVNGANLGDAPSDATQLQLADVFALRGFGQSCRLSIAPTSDGSGFNIAPDSVTGRPNARIHLDCCATFMSGDGKTTEIILLVETENGSIVETYLLPLAPLVPKSDYALVSFDEKVAIEKFADVACVSFARGTHVLMADGAQVLIETLQIGDLVMSRDSGPQPVRWIGQQTVRAIGEFAPIVIAKGALNNSRDLTLAANHRLFIYQRRDQVGAGSAEIMVRAGLLVNGDTIVQSSGGFVDYFQLLFDKHEIIYVEGIAAESMLADHRAQASLPKDVRDKLAETLGTTAIRKISEVVDGQLPANEAVKILRSASEG